MTEQNLETTETDPKVEEAKEYTKEALMKLSKPALIAVAGEIGVDLAVLPKLTKDLISDAVIVFLEPHLDYEAPDDPPIESIEEELAEPTAPVELEGLAEPEEPIEVEELVEVEEIEELSEPQLPVEVMKIVAPELIEEVEVEEPVEPIEPPTDTAIGSYQETLRPTEVEKSVRVRRIEESSN